MKRENTRMDIASRQRFPKEKLIRFVMSPSGEILVDVTGNAKGRGVYLHKDAASLEKALSKHCFERAFHRPLSEEEIARVKEAL